MGAGPGAEAALIGVGLLCVVVSLALPAPMRADTSTRLTADTATRGRGDAVTGRAASPASARLVGAFGPVLAGWKLASAASAEYAPEQEVARFAASPRSRVPASAVLRPGLFPADTPVSARARPPEIDRWFAEDKLKHFLMSFAVTSVGYAAARTAGLSHSSALAAGSGAGAAAGVWKEARDRLSGGDVSARDLVWDGIGVAVGGVVSAQIR